MNIVCFYESLIVNNKLTEFSRDCKELIKLWKLSWSKYGWNPIVLSVSDAKKHPRYEEIDLKNYSSNLYRYSINGANYLELCYSRWFAYGIYDGVWSDYDVINYGFTPEHIKDLTNKDPVFFDSIGSCGFSTIQKHNLIIDGIIQAYQKDDIVNDIFLLQDKYRQQKDISDMHINRRQNTPISFLNNNICISNFHDNQWRQSQLVHYHNGLWNNFPNHESKTRSDFIIKERPV